jgi:hypothetical protein
MVWEDRNDPKLKSNFRREAIPWGIRKYSHGRLKKPDTEVNELPRSQRKSTALKRLEKFNIRIL